MLIQLIVSGILLGGIYALLSIGLSLMLGVSKFINFAHGDFVMIGMYLTYLFYASFKLNPYISWPLVLVGGAVFGVVIFTIAKRAIGKSPVNQILLTLGLSMILQNVILLIFKSDFKAIPSEFSNSIKVGTVFVSGAQLITFGLAILTTVGFLIFIKNTRLGRAMRAVGEDRNASKLMGINVPKIDLMVFCLGTVMAAFSGALLMTMYPTYPTVGSGYNLLAWITVILGGLGHLQGALIAALIIGISETLTGFYLGADLRQLVYFVIFIIVLVVSPQGLFHKFSIRKVKRL
ncbi:branched-chain amino acid ABC transporter permease [Vallitalea pronyensis]|uniref:Branched-chain amino acid ABC transporter permease n=1 Tax=Vallitalea pronyensis TaxID=1348613 RepID=A0A8J8MMS2_9FIRM|nr:branched-chain amino acid ABC transporter permease [Vallitalea pronyensis]QUI24307.1 branched-chain amino acid ABC transporter permease [Vallitalea pronyensis]